MVYISPDGSVHNSQPWGISRILSIFFGIFSAIVMFIKTLITPFTNPNNNYESEPRAPSSFFRWGGGGGGGGSGGSGGMGPPRPPRRRMGGINHAANVSVPGGCAGGSCGR